MLMAEKNASRMRGTKSLAGRSTDACCLAERRNATPEAPTRNVSAARSTRRFFTPGGLRKVAPTAELGGGWHADQPSIVSPRAKKSHLHSGVVAGVESKTATFRWPFFLLNQ